MELTVLPQRPDEFVLSKSERASLSVGKWVYSELQSVQPSKEIALQALRHLPQKIKRNLFSKDLHTKHNAIGQWYETVIYESLLRSTSKSSDYTLIAKWNDVPRHKRTSPRLGQDGLYYDEAGTVVARGNGQDLGEFDVILTNRQNEIAFAEVIKSGKNLGYFEAEISYKRRLLSFLFSHPVQFILISCVDVSNKSTIKPIINLPESFFVMTGNLDELCNSLRPADVEQSQQKANVSPILVSDLATTNINYLKSHNLCRDELIKAVMSGKAPDFKSNCWLIKRIIVGYLDESGIRTLLSEKDVIVQGKRLNFERFRASFSRAILALSLPDFRPVLYLRLRAKPVYLKMGPFTTSTFKFERNIYRYRTAFFSWLGNIDLEVGPDVMSQILSEYLNESVACSRKKAGESESLS